MPEWLKLETAMGDYAGKDMEKDKHSSTAGGSANLYSDFRDQYHASSGKWESVYHRNQQFSS